MSLNLEMGIDLLCMKNAPYCQTNRTKDWTIHILMFAIVKVVTVINSV
jgi:hypothetical protein